MSKFGSQELEDINISFNKEMHQYVIDASYRKTDREGNVDIVSIRDLPISICDYPIIDHSIEYFDCTTNNVTTADLGFGKLDFHPRFTKVESRRIHTATKEMTLEEIEKKLGYKVKIVSDNKEE